MSDQKIAFSNTIDEDVAQQFYALHDKLVKYATRNGKIRPQKGEVLSFLLKKAMKKITIKEFFND